MSRIGDTVGGIADQRVGSAVDTRDRPPARTAVRRLALSRIVSLSGTYAASIALAYSIYQQTRSTGWVAATMILTLGAVGFFGPAAGAISDRFDRRRVMILAEVGAAGCWALMALVADTPALLLGLALLASLSEAMFVPASGAAIPNLAGEDNLAWANGLIAVGRCAGLTVGPLTGGVLFAAVGPRWVFGLNAISFVVSAGLVASVRGSFAEPGRPPALPGHGGLGVGFRFVAREPVLRQMLASWVVFVLGTASTIVAEPLLADDFGAGSVGYGALTACWGGGTIVGAWLSRGVRQDREALWIVSFSGLMAATCFAVALSARFWMILVWVAAFGLADGPTQVVEQNLLQRRTPDAVRGRVLGAWEAVMTVSFVAALLLGGLVVGSVGPQGSFAFAGILATIGSGLLLPLLRWLREKPAVDEDVTGAVAARGS